MTILEITDYGVLQYPKIKLKNKEIKVNINKELQNKAKLIQASYVGVTRNSVYAENLINLTV